MLLHFDDWQCFDCKIFSNEYFGIKSDNRTWLVLYHCYEQYHVFSVDPYLIYIQYLSLNYSKFSKERSSLFFRIDREALVNRIKNRNQTYSYKPAADFFKISSCDRYCTTAGISVFSILCNKRGYRCGNH